MTNPAADVKSGRRPELGGRVEPVLPRAAASRRDPGAEVPVLPARPRHVALVAVGGAVGAVARVALAEARPLSPGELPVVTLLENLTGAFLLAVLLTVLGRRSVADPTVRLLVGTGVLGSFTTYSTHSVELVVLLEVGARWLAGGYLAVTLVGGLLAAAAGMSLGRRLTPQAAGARSADPGGDP